MSEGEAPAERDFRRRLADRLTALRLRIDLGEIRTLAAFRSALEDEGGFEVDDPRVHRACAAAGLDAWLGKEGTGES